MSFRGLLIKCANIDHGGLFDQAAKDILEKDKSETGILKYPTPPAVSPKQFAKFEEDAGTLHNKDLDTIQKWETNATNLNQLDPTGMARSQERLEKRYNPLPFNSKHEDMVLGGINSVLNTFGMGNVFKTRRDLENDLLNGDHAKNPIRYSNQQRSYFGELDKIQSMTYNNYYGGYN